MNLYYWEGFDTKTQAAINLVLGELRKAQDKHRPMYSLHEGYAVIKEEVDELWDEIKAQIPSLERTAKEAAQVGAMGIRFLADIALP